MELRHLRYLVAVAEELHFGRAALRLNISQPPLSQQILQLEDELGVQLFQRTKRKVVLTEAGRRLVTEALQVLAKVDHLAKVAARAGGGEIGHLSVGVPAGVSSVLVETLRRLGKEYPGIRLELQYMSTGMQLEALRNRQIDVGFLNLPVQDTTLEVECIAQEPLWLALPKGHPLAAQKRIPLSALNGEAMILFPRRVTPGLHDAIMGLCKVAGVTLHVVHEVDSIVGGLTLVSAGLGIAFGTPGVERLWPGIEFRPVRELALVEQGVGYRRDAASPALETFLRVVRETLRRQHGDKNRRGRPSSRRSGVKAR